MRLFVPKERVDGETRVALTPETAKKLRKAGFDVSMEAGAGAGAHLTDAEYERAEVQVLDDAAAREAFGSADVVLKVRPPTESELVQGSEADALGEGAVLLSFLEPWTQADTLGRLAERGVSALSMELVPRISRAQSMDALSSQASIAGYKAVLLAATQLDKYFPLLMTAAGTVQPAKVVVMGAGVAGLQAIATAKRLGAVIEVSDIRPAVKEQVESLGGKFIDLPMDESGEGEGGYAKEVTEDFLRRQQAIVAERVQHADAVITTALVPGKKAPRLVTREMVESMRPGSVIVDLAVTQGGNCELSKPDEAVEHDGVSILGPSNLPATLARDASTLYARNLTALLGHVAPKGELSLDLEDEIVDGALVTHSGEVRKDLGGTA